MSYYFQQPFKQICYFFDKIIYFQLKHILFSTKQAFIFQPSNISFFNQGIIYFQPKDNLVLANINIFQSSKYILNDWVSKFGRHLDQISTPQCRSLVEVWCRSLVDILSNLLCISLIYRATFDQTSTLGVSKFGRRLVEVSTLGGLNLVEISTKLRPPSVEVWSN